MSTRSRADPWWGPWKKRPHLSLEKKPKLEIKPMEIRFISDQDHWVHLPLGFYAQRRHLLSMFGRQS